jgi:hypothetical protein
MKPLEELVDAALAASDELASASSQPQKLSAAAFIKAAHHVAGAGQKQATLILESIDLPENAMLLPSFRRLISKIIERDTTGPWRLISPYIDAEADACLGRLRCTRESFFLAASIHAAERFPERFGEATEPGASADLVASLRAKRDDAVAELSAALQPLVRLGLLDKRSTQATMDLRRDELRKTARAA